nr:pentapeptide repeat-containing protein [Candidatus Accumulibacter sp. ACC003]
MAGARMASTDFRRADLGETDLRGSNTKWANFTGANLASADLRNADLFHATFDDASLAGADARSANLFGANLINAKAAGADFSGAYLKDVLMEGIDLSGGSIRDCHALFNGANLEAADFTDADLWDSNFANVRNLDDSVRAALAEPCVVRRR